MLKLDLKNPVVKKAAGITVAVVVGIISIVDTIAGQQKEAKL